MRGAVQDRQRSLGHLHVEEERRRWRIMAMLRHGCLPGRPMGPHRRRLLMDRWPCCGLEPKMPVRLAPSAHGSESLGRATGSCTTQSKAREESTGHGQRQIACRLDQQQRGFVARCFGRRSDGRRLSCGRRGAAAVGCAGTSLEWETPLCHSEDLGLFCFARLWDDMMM